MLMYAFARSTEHPRILLSLNAVAEEVKFGALPSLLSISPKTSNQAECGYPTTPTSSTNFF